MVAELFRENDPLFNSTLYPVTDLFISMRINKNHESLPDGQRALLDNLRREITTVPTVNKGALVGMFVFVIIEVIN